MKFGIYRLSMCLVEVGMTCVSAQGWPILTLLQFIRAKVFSG